MATPGWVNSGRRHELPRDWSAVRRRVLERDRWLCQWSWCDQVATDVDHIIPGADHREENLQALCHPHHVEKTNRERVVANQRRPRERHPGEF